MTPVFSLSGPAPALLLLAALLAAGARADTITTAECKARRAGGRVRQHPTDSSATDLWMELCNLTEINPDEFIGLPNLNNLSLRRNKLRELPVFDQHSCPNLTYLALSYNQLTGIDNAGTFSACAKLERLDLDNNNIVFIHFNAFSGLTELRTLFLYNNKIRFIPDQMFTSHSKLEVLYLNNNRITHLPADFASSQKRAGADLTELAFLENPWHCACLLELLADAKRAGVSVYYSCNGVWPECNYISMREYPCRKIRELNFIAHGVP